MRGLVGNRVGSLVTALAVAATSAGAQLLPVHVDTFEDGTTQNWRIGIGPGLGGAPPPAGAVPANVLGGPGGPGDHYLRLNASGAPGAGGRLAVINYAGQWVGNYLAMGIQAIRMDARNFGNTDLALRLLFENPALPPTPGPPTDLAVSGVPLLLPAGGGWTSLLFPLFGPGGLVPLGGSDLAALLSNTTAIRIIHLPAALPPADNGPPIAATLGVDNITALATPEPATVALLGAGLVALAVVRRRRPR